MIADWLATLRAWGKLYNRVRPTAAGIWYMLIVLGVAAGAMNTGNNLVYAVLAVLMAILVVNNVLAEWNLRGLTARRVLPAEFFAGESARGRVIVANPRRVGPALAVFVTELPAPNAEGATSSEVSRVEAGGEAEAFADWSFGKRGAGKLQGLRVGSTYPFGLLLRYRDLDAPAEVLVYPQAKRGATAIGAEGRGVDAQAQRPRVEATGEFLGLRPYQAGDPVRRIHAPSSGRMSTPMVILRSSETGRTVLLRLTASGEAREVQVQHATFDVLHHTAQGDEVGLDTGEALIPPASGPGQRRALLTALALA